MSCMPGFERYGTGKRDRRNLYNPPERKANELAALARRFKTLSNWRPGKPGPIEVSEEVSSGNATALVASTGHDVSDLRWPDGQVWRSARLACRAEPAIRAAVLALDEGERGGFTGYGRSHLANDTALLPGARQERYAPRTGGKRGQRGEPGFRDVVARGRPADGGRHGPPSVGRPSTNGMWGLLDGAKWETGWGVAGQNRVPGDAGVE